VTLSRHAAPALIRPRGGAPQCPTGTMLMARLTITRIVTNQIADSAVKRSFTRKIRGIVSGGLKEMAFV